MEFIIGFDVEKITESASHASVPVQAYDSKGVPLFESPMPVSIRLKFYKQMRTAKNANKVSAITGNAKWVDELAQICKTRVEGRVNKVAESITYEDKRKLMRL